jgi:aromatic ring hydroxylase
MRTSEQYREKLLSMRKNVYRNGSRIERDDPLMSPGVNVICKTFDAVSTPAWLLLR